MTNIDKIYKKLIDDIGSTLQRTRENAIKAVNRELVIANWGKHIFEFEQNGKEKAEYGSSLLTNLSKDLKTTYGKGLEKVTFIFAGNFILNIQFSRQCPEN